jgi:hypothetical protein
MSLNYTHLWHLLRKTFSAWSGHEASRLGAALALYSILSLAPLMVLVVAIAGFVFGHSSAQNQIIAETEEIIWQQGAGAVRAMTEKPPETRRWSHRVARQYRNPGVRRIRRLWRTSGCPQPYVDVKACPLRDLENGASEALFLRDGLVRRISAHGFARPQRWARRARIGRRRKR